MGSKKTFSQKKWTKKTTIRESKSFIRIITMFYIPKSLHALKGFCYISQKVWNPFPVYALFCKSLFVGIPHTFFCWQETSIQGAAPCLWFYRIVLKNVLFHFHGLVELSGTLSKLSRIPMSFLRLCHVIQKSTTEKTNLEFF